MKSPEILEGLRGPQLEDLGGMLGEIIVSSWLGEAPFVLTLMMMDWMWS